MRAINVWVSRARLALEAGGKLDLEDLGSNLEHAMELGLRNDGGDAETGFGLELGGELRYADPARGLTVELRGRDLLMLQDGDYRERGAAGAILPDPGAEGLGLSISMHPCITTNSQTVA